MATNTKAMPYTSTKNILLMKSEVGKAKTSIYKLPDQNFSYGKAYVKDKEGAKEVSMSWNAHQSTRDPIPIVDFKQVNKEKLKMGGSKDFKPIAVEKKQEKQQNAKKNTLPDPNFTYGKKVKPSTPIGKLLSNNFGEESENALNDLYKKQIEEKNAKEKPTVKQNKSQLLTSNKNKQRIEEKAKENEKTKVFTLKKFQNVEPKINTNKAKPQPQQQPQTKLPEEIKNEEDLKLVEKYFEKNNKNN